MEQITKCVEVQFSGQETATTNDGLPQQFESTLFFLFRGLDIGTHQRELVT